MANVIQSKTKDLKKIFIIAWVVIALVFLVVVGSSWVGFSDYEQGQLLAVELMLAASSEFDEHDDYQTLIKEMYEFFTVEYSSFSFNGQHFDNSDAVESARKADKHLAELLKSAGYHCSQGSKYLKYSNFTEYLFGEFGIIFCLLTLLPMLGLIAIQITYFSEAGKSLTIKENKVICKFSEGGEKEYLLDNIQTVETTILNGVKFSGKNIEFSISFLENPEELKAPIAAHIAARPKVQKSRSMPTIKTTPNASPKTTEEIKEYKILLDMGAITQEEYDNKKKQLLSK